MMNVSEITARLYAIGAAILEKTGEKPWLTPSMIIKDDACRITLYRDFGNGKSYTIGTAKGDTPEAALDDADRIIAALPDPETTKLHSHMARLAECVDKARDDGIADEYVQPIRMTVAAITANLLPAPGAGQ